MLSSKQRVLLAVLLLNANRAVPVEALIDALWDDAPPRSARVTLQGYVSRLRQSLGPQAGQRVVTRPPGYLMVVGGGELDLDRFTGLCDQARSAADGGDWLRAAGLLREALSLWQGDPLGDVPAAAVQRTEVPRLAELRMRAVEFRVEADLRLGRHGELVAELRRLAGGEPLREGLHGHLMLALYRCGRQAEALEVFRGIDQRLRGQLGISAGPALQRLHQRILAAEPSLTDGLVSRLDVPLVRADPSPAADQALAGLAQLPPAERAKPRELPPAVPGFTGRSAELAALTRLLDKPGEQAPGTIVISAIGGTAGVGKTALALHWAHQVVDRFPDGQLYINLRGFDPSGIPATPAEVVRGFLDALGVAPERIPQRADAQAGLYRSLLVDKQMLIVLDNARDEDQVRMLLPASPGSLVIVTSRNQLSGLDAAHAARLLRLDVLTHDEATQMLVARMDRTRAAAEPDAVDEIAALCACLPLALGVAAARASARPGFSLAALTAELRDASGRLDALDAGDPAASVRAVFSWSYQQLSSEAARMFRLLGLHPGPDIGVRAAASLAASNEPRARRLLRELARHCLITEHAPGRYTLHDLLRSYAADQARDTDSEPERDAAIGRVLDHYLHTAGRAALLLRSLHEPCALAPPRPGAVPEELADFAQALAWFEAELQVLLSAITLADGSCFDVYAWQLPWAMMPFLRKRGHWQEWIAAQRTALAAATRLGDIAGQAVSGRLLADACNDLGDSEQALGYYMTSLELYRRLSDRRGEAKALQGLGVLASRQARYADALGYDDQALRLYRAVGLKADEAVTLYGIGWDHGLLGDFEQERAFCRQALELNAEVGTRDVGGPVLQCLGHAEHHLGNFTEAAQCFHRALGIQREFGDRLGEALTLAYLGDTHLALRELAQARWTWQQALTILEDLRHPEADKVRARLASTEESAARKGHVRAPRNGTGMPTA
jgi:DNA-binding SARP family transcriptional activator/tetratricopeptide (TPR) repeat protein